MPIVLIETRRGWIHEPTAVIDAIYFAVQAALKVPDWDRTVRLVEHEPDRFPPPPGKGERFTLVNVTMFHGRSMDAKRSLYAGIVSGLERLGVSPGDTMIYLTEVPMENMAVFGPRPASEVDLGFSVNV